MDNLPKNKGTGGCLMKTKKSSLEKILNFKSGAFSLALLSILGCKLTSTNKDVDPERRHSIVLKGTDDQLSDDKVSTPGDDNHDKGSSISDDKSSKDDDSGKGGGVNQSPTICRFIDPSQNIKEAIPGSPTEIIVPISDYTKRPELLTKTGTDISFNYTIFQRQDGSQKTLFWDSHSKNWYAVNWKATIKNSDSKACTITAVATSAPELRTMRGCFDPSTKITMADGTLKRVDQIAMNDHVANPLTGGFGIVVRITKGPEAEKGMYEIGYDQTNFVVVTSKHPFITSKGLKQAKDLVAGDEIAVKNGYKKIGHVLHRKADKSQQVFNFALATGKDGEIMHAVEADGVVTGDLFLQERLETLKGLQKSIAEVSH
jgi:hypothetical protein